MTRFPEHSHAVVLIVIVEVEAARGEASNYCRGADTDTHPLHQSQKIPRHLKGRPPLEFYLETEALADLFQQRLPHHQVSVRSSVLMHATMIRKPLVFWHSLIKAKDELFRKERANRRLFHDQNEVGHPIFSRNSAMEKIQLHLSMEVSNSPSI